MTKPLQHESLLSAPNWLPGHSGYWVSVREAISDLPLPTEHDAYDHSKASYPEAKLTAFRSLMQSSYLAAMWFHEAIDLAENIRRAGRIEIGGGKRRGLLDVIQQHVLKHPLPRFETALLRLLTRPPQTDL